jgi:hypothetical protein
VLRQRDGYGRKLRTAVTTVHQAGKTDYLQFILVAGSSILAGVVIQYRATNLFTLVILSIPQSNDAISFAVGFGTLRD